VKATKENMDTIIGKEIKEKLKKLEKN